MVSPYFPPDSGAGSHRVRLLAPHLREFGWEPTVLSVTAESYEGRLDQDLLAMVPDGLRVVRVTAWSVDWTRRLRVGDLGIRAVFPLYRACRSLLRDESFDAWFVTVYPSYPAMLAPMLKRHHSLPCVLDYQDPWVGAWGLTIGAAPNGAPELKSRLSRRLASWLEPIATRSVDAITAVSEKTYEDVVERNPNLKPLPRLELPLGGEPSDFEYLRSHPRSNPIFDRNDGKVHLSYVGTLLPLGKETLDAFLQSVVRLRERQPGLYQKLRVHFVGTSNQTAGRVSDRALPRAKLLGLMDVVTEHALRLDYLDALNVLVQSDAVVLMGSSERHYTASKLYPALLARKSMLTIFHQQSTVADIVSRAAKPPVAQLILYDDEARAGSRVEAIFRGLKAIVEDPGYDAEAVDLNVVQQFEARTMAERLASLLDGLASPRAVRQATDGR